MFIFFINSLNIYAQKKQFYNQFWEQTEQESALYYTITSFNKDLKLFQSSDYYFNDSLQMKGFFQDKNLNIKEGEFFYLHYNGNISLIKNYHQNLLEGVYKAFNYNGIIEEEGYYHLNKKDGTWKTFYPNGKVKSITVYNGNYASYTSFYPNGNTNEIGKLLNDHRTGLWKKYDENKNILNMGYFQNNLREKKWSFYFSDGQISAEIMFNNGAISSQKYWNKNGEVVSEGKVSYPPVYKNGQESINDFVKNNCDISYLKGKKLKGKMYFSFLVLPDGSIEGVKLIKGVYSALDIQVFNSLQKMNGWTPGMLYYRFVPIEHVVAIDVNIFNL